MMAETEMSSATVVEAAMDVFAAARWLAEQWNSDARAVSPNEVEWQCSTWGSGEGRGDWLETAKFVVAREFLGLRSWSNYEGRDELVVSVPLDRFPALVDLLDLLGEEPEAWPWLQEEDETHVEQVAGAAAALGVSVESLSENGRLLEALRIR